MRSAILLFTALIAIPASAMELDITPPVPGYQMTLTVTDADPGEVVHFGVSSDLGSGPCATTEAGSIICAELDDPYVLGSARADASGQAVLTLTLPDPLPDTAFYFQAVQLSGAGDITDPLWSPIAMM